MKYPIPAVSAFLAIIIISHSGCKKSGSESNSPKDTLTAGWAKTGNPFSNFIQGGDIAFQDNTTGYVSSRSQNATYKTTNGGYSWSYIYNMGFHNMCLTPDHKLFGVNLMYDTLYRSGDGGISFSRQQPASLHMPYDVAFGDNNTGILCAYQGFFYTQNGGLSWNSLGLLPGIVDEAAASMFNNNTGWVVYNNKVYHANGTITSWHLDTVPAPTSNIGLTAIAPVSASVVYVVSITGYLFKSTDGGYSFTFLQKIPNGNLTSKCDMQFLDAATGYLSNGSRIYKTTDGGNNWSVIVALENQTINEIHFIDASHGWALCNNGEVLKFN